MENIIIGTAGHIDHGKTTLIKYLTGKNTDTLPEEKKRGITIDIGFSFLDIGDKKVGIVDVPGHEKFIKNMTAGVSGIDYVILLVASDDGIMPQTKEHFDIINFLGIKHGVIVLTKTDLVSEEIVKQRKEEIKEFFKGSFLENSKIFETSINDKNSFSKLKDFLVEDIEKIENEKREKDNKSFRMYVDRCFTVKGFGTVVTGTVMQGKINVSDTFYIYPQGIKGKVKGIENHGNKIESIGSGNRCALNLSQIDKKIIKRGNIISSLNDFESSNIVDVMFEPLREKKIKNNQRIRLHLGTREVIGRIKFFNKDLIYIDKNSKTEKILAQLILEEEIAGIYGELGIIRNFSPMETIGGIKLLNIFGKKVKRNNIEYIEKLLKLDRDGKILDKEDNSSKLREILENFHRENYLAKGILRPQLKNIYFENLSIKDFRELLDKNISYNIIESNKIENKEYISLKNFKVKLKKEDKILKEKIYKIYKENGLIPQKRSIIEKEFENEDKFIPIHDYLLNEGMIVYLSEDYYILRGFFKEIQKIIKGYFENNDKLTISELRNLLNIDRELAIIVLEKLDSLKFTKRINNYRILEKEM